MLRLRLSVIASLTLNSGTKLLSSPEALHKNGRPFHASCTFLGSPKTIRFGASRGPHVHLSLFVLSARPIQSFSIRNRDLDIKLLAGTPPRWHPHNGLVSDTNVHPRAISRAPGRDHYGLGTVQKCVLSILFIGRNFLTLHPIAKLCRNYALGHCPQGDQCKYLHSMVYPTQPTYTMAPVAAPTMVRYVA